ncbi:hypothetical protein HHI36_000936 [Cryptolaemus montrouzieri]|uniref:Uncharacterized protein n=1 Tax=Cryptolaemus montrouzieri TaxID=559131 RepID=A0ABD2P6B5_9CUCU
MYFKVIFPSIISLLLLVSLLSCEDENETEGESKDSSVEANQTSTQTTGSRRLGVGTSAPYQAPRSIAYPFGDEEMINNNMLNSSATTDANCADENEFMEYKPECTGPVEGTDELYVACLKSDLTAGPTDTIYTSSISGSSRPVNLPELICKTCNLQKNADNTGVLVYCHNCYDLGSPLNRTEQV